MSNPSRLKGLLIGVIIALFSAALVFGTFILAFSETNPSVELPSSQPLSAAFVVTLPSTDQRSPSVIITLPSATNISVTITITPSITSTTCPIPPGWKPIAIRSGDTLNKLAMQYGIPPQTLADGNCLSESRLTPGTTLYVPAVQPTEEAPDQAPDQCGPPTGWVAYYVQPNDTLYNIGLRVGLTVNQLMYYNCLTSEFIQVGQLLYVPYSPQPLPSPTGVPTKVPPRPTKTPLPPEPTIGPISRDTPKPTLSPPNP